MAASQNPNTGHSRFNELLARGQYAWRLFSSPQVPAALKIIPVLAALYVVSPIDLLPDMALGLGQLDDIAILLLGLRLFTQLADGYALGSGKSTASPPHGAPSADREVTTSYRVRED